jgi:hypothetical protein
MTHHSPDPGNMVRPVRLRLSRQKGFNLHAHSLAVNGLPAVSVARPGKWGNPFKVGESYPIYEDDLCQILVGETGTLTPVEAVHAYRMDGPRLGCFDDIEELRGKNLACWCPLDAPCHADVLLELANKET